MKGISCLRGALITASTALLALGLVGCGSGRDVEVKGEVAAPASVGVSGPIRLEFFDVVGEQRELAHELELDAPGAFDEQVSLEGDRLVVRAISDDDGDGACTPGEAWAELEAEIAEDDSVEPLTLTLAQTACPSAEAAD